MFYLIDEVARNVVKDCNGRVVEVNSFRFASKLSGIYSRKTGHTVRILSEEELRSMMEDVLAS